MEEQRMSCDFKNMFVSVEFKDVFINEDGENLLHSLGNSPDEILRKIVNTLNDLNYVLFKDGSVNLILIRNTKIISGYFDDLELVIRYLDSRVLISVYSVTTDPSEVFLLRGLEKGTAILKNQQIRGLWKIGLHKGQYDALIQNNKCWVIRDFNKDNLLDFKLPTYYDVRIIIKINSYITRFDYYRDGVLIFREEYGLFGINNHRASTKRKLIRIGVHSMGCVTHQDSNEGYNTFIEDVYSDRNKFGNTFTGTILLKEEIHGANR